MIERVFSATSFLNFSTEGGERNDCNLGLRCGIGGVGGTEVALVF